jgi:hypothetical protein
MNVPFDFDFDKAEEEIKKEKEKLEKFESPFPGFSPWVWSLPDSKWEANIYYDGDILSEHQFGKVRLEKENFRVKQDCSFCKNNVQSRINTCRKCKIRDRRNTQSNFVLDKTKEIQPRFKLNQIWNSVFVNI